MGTIASVNGAPLPIATAEPEDTAEEGAGAAELATAAEVVAGAEAAALVAGAALVDVLAAAAGVELDAVLDADFFDEHAATSVTLTATIAAERVTRQREPRGVELNIFRLLSWGRFDLLDDRVTGGDDPL